jgi:outer membrane protein insertion porin family/translocation and assembly module TamA
MRPFLAALGLTGWFLIVVASTACVEEGTIKVHKLKFSGVTAVDPGALKNVLATKESSIIPWGKKRYFDRSRFDADLKRVEAFYADRGYPDARVTSFDVKLNKTQDAVDLSVTVTEGEPVRVTSVAFVGFDVIPEEHLADLKNRTPLKVGQPRDRQQVASTRELAINELRDHGFPYAKVTTNEDDGTNGKMAALSFTAEPGKIAHFGPVEVAGNQTVSEGVIRRELAFQPGDLYRRSLVQNTQRRLYRMELFQFANVESLNTELQPEEVPTRITVAEGKHQRVNFGIGYGTEEKGRADAEYHHLNFLGGARSAGLHVRWSSLDRGARVDFTQPYFFAPHLSLGLEGQQWYTFTPAYQSIVSGGKATMTHRADANTSWSISVTSEHDRSAISEAVLNDLSLRNSLIALGLDPTTGEQSGTLNALGFDLQHSTADNLLNAHRGYQLAFHTEQAGRIVPGTFNYYSMSVDGRHYLPIGGDRFVVATRLQLGSIRAVGNDQTNIPFAKKFFLGGATSVRGWGRYEISPLGGDSGLPIGGDSMLAFSAELRAGLRGNLGGVLFVDAGNVWPGPWEMKFSDLRYAVGPGLRYQTPIGPVRFDVGYQLNPIPGLLVNGAPQSRRWRIHFSIGQAF